MNGIVDPSDYPVTIYDTIPNESMAGLEMDKWRNLIILFVVGAAIVYLVIK